MSTKNGKSSGNPNLVIRLPQVEHDALAKVAKKRGQKKSEVARHAIRREIERAKP